MINNNMFLTLVIVFLFGIFCGSLTMMFMMDSIVKHTANQILTEYFESKNYIEDYDHYLALKKKFEEEDITNEKK